MQHSWSLIERAPERNLFAQSRNFIITTAVHCCSKARSVGVEFDVVDGHSSGEWAKQNDEGACASGLAARSTRYLFWINNIWYLAESPYSQIETPNTPMSDTDLRELGSLGPSRPGSTTRVSRAPVRYSFSSSNRASPHSSIRAAMGQGLYVVMDYARESKIGQPEIKGCHYHGATPGHILVSRSATHRNFP
jgi:hypothetical protein